MNARRPLLGFIAASLLAFSMVGGTGCGGETDSGGKTGSLPPEFAPEPGEIFLRNRDGALDLVRVDLATGARGRIGQPLPVRISATAFVSFWMSAEGSRVVVSVPSHDNLETIFVLDRGADGATHWRTLADDAMFVLPSAHGNIVSYSTRSGGGYLLHLVRYDGESVAEVTAPSTSVNDVYPQVAAMSPAGNWVVVRRSLGDIAAYAIPERGRASGPSAPSVQRELVPLCALSSTFIASANDRGMGQDAYWFEPSFTSIEVAGFLGQRSKVASRLNTKECGFQVDGEENGLRSVSVIDNQSLSRGFRFDGRLGELLDANDEHWLVGDSHYASASLTLGSTKTSTTVATYTPLPPVRPVPAEREAQRMVTVFAHSLGAERQAVVAHVRTDHATPGAASNDYPTPHEESNELWVVEGGQARPTVRLAEGPYEAATGWPKLPRNYVFSKDGKHLYWTSSDAGKLRVWVRDLPNGDGERVLDGTLFTATRPMR